MKLWVHVSLTVAAAWLVPACAFAVAPPPLPDAPFFGWLAVPVVAVVGRKMLKKKKGADPDRL